MKSLIIPEQILQSTRMSQEEMKVEIAVMLFQKMKLTLMILSMACCTGLSSDSQLFSSNRSAIISSPWRWQPML